MRWNAQPYGRLPSRDEAFGLLGALENQSQRAGPEALGQRVCSLRNLTAPSKSFFGRSEMQNDRMVGGTALDGIEACNRFLARRVGTEAVDRFGGKSDESAGA